MADSVLRLKSAFSSANYRLVADRLEEASSWLTAHGLDVPRSRVEEYRRCLGEMARRYDDGTLNSDEPMPDLPTFCNAAFEVTELVRIYDGLSPVVSPILSSKLKQFIRGKVRRSSQRYDPGRDVAFELYIASRFAKAGYPIDFSTDADLKLIAHGHEVFVECKRPHSRKMLSKVIAGGLKQLHKRYQTADNPLSSRGIFMISIGAVVCPDEHFLVANSERELASRTKSYSGAFVRAHQRIWHGVRDKRTIGAVIQLDIPGMVRSTNMFTTCHDTAVNNTCPPNSSDCDLLRRIATELAKNVHGTRWEE